MSSSQLAAEFERVILPHLDSAYNFARWLLRNEQDAQDAVHDSFLRAHRYFGSFDGSDGKTWLLGIVRNVCFTVLRGNKTRERSTGEERELQASHEPSPERAAILKEDLEALRRCIEALPDEYRETLVLREIEELPYKEIAAAVGIAMGTVMSRLSRARIRLEECLAGRRKEVSP